MKLGRFRWVITLFSSRCSKREVYRPWRAALEPTRDNHRPIAHRLLHAGVEVVIVSSVAKPRYREAKLNSWDKNNPKDASIILDILEHNMVMRYVDPMLAGHINRYVEPVLFQCLSDRLNHFLSSTNRNCGFLLSATLLK